MPRSPHLAWCSLVLAGAAGCSKPVPSATAPSGNRTASSIAAPSSPVRLVPEPDAGIWPADMIDQIARDGGPGVPICFGWSPAGNVVCDVGESSIQGGATMAIRVLGPDADEFTYYTHDDEDGQFFDVDPARLDRAALARARATVVAIELQAWNGPMVEVELDAPAEVGGLSLRRKRTRTGEDGDPMTGVWELHRDEVELRCGDRWVPLPLEGDVFANTIEAPEIGAARLGDALVLTAMVSWGIEGDHGGGRDATMLDVGALCPALTLAGAR